MSELGTQALAELAKELGVPVRTLSPGERARCGGGNGPRRDFAWLETTINGLRGFVFYDVGTNGPMFGIAVITNAATVSSIIDPIYQRSSPRAHYQATGPGNWCLDGGAPNPKLDRYIFVGCRDGVLYATPWAAGITYGQQQIALLALRELATYGALTWRPLNDSERKAKVKNDRKIWWVAAGVLAWAVIQQLVMS